MKSLRQELASGVNSKDFPEAQLKANSAGTLCGTEFWMKVTEIHQLMVNYILKKET